VNDTVALWVYLSSTPLLWLTVTLGAWLASDWLALRARRNALVNPVLICIVLISALLLATGTPYRLYFEGAQFVHFLLGPAIVAIAVPLVVNSALVRANLLPLLAALAAGSVTAMVSVVLLGRVFGLPEDVLLALVPKSVTAGVAMGIAEQIGGGPPLTALLVVLTGVTGAVLVMPLMTALRIKDHAARGFTAGLSAHGIGTARAFEIDPVAGAFAGIAMGLNAVLTAMLAPALAAWLI
jgi:predicted murein hydrolase (TIGR00659 family)